MEYFVPEADEKELKKERAKAREIRKSQWWKRKCAEGVCYFCGKKVPPNELTMDHIVPLIRGGKSNRGNIVPACKDCNNRKKHMLPLEWSEYMDKLAEEKE